MENQCFKPLCGILLNLKTELKDLQLRLMIIICFRKNVLFSKKKKNVKKRYFYIKYVETTNLMELGTNVYVFGN